MIVVTLLTFSALMYLVARQGALQRFARHTRVPRAIIEKYFSKHHPTLTILIPSYSEEPEVIRKTILSAALQEFVHAKVVLLIDDEPNPNDPAKLARLTATRELATQLNTLLAKPYNRFARSMARLQVEMGKQKEVEYASNAWIERLIKHYEWGAAWLKQRAVEEKREDHVDDFFAEQVLLELANELELIAKALKLAREEGARLAVARVHELLARLVAIFGTQVECFERKAYLNLSHEANKAMNLNAYIGLMGKSYRKEQTPEGVVLVEENNKRSAEVVIENSDYVLTLDADSILLRDYCLRLVYFMQQKENADVAVVQTPYSAFRGASTRIERISGATTDIQHLLHQGMSHYGAAFWVGANAVIRKKALDEIVVTETVGGYEVKRYIQDHTVIEDTESSIDLTAKRWRIVNYPERLSYSATPPDFGALVVQRRRWANGGLLIMAKYLGQIRKRQLANEDVSPIETMLRINYMASIAWSSFGLIFLLVYPYDGRLLSPLVLLAALPYFILMAKDLKNARYQYSDILRIYGFNLILLPVNLAGVLKSIEQALTAKKIPFARTPKVKNRTAAAPIYVLFPLFIIGFSIMTLYRNVVLENWGNAAFAAFNALTAMWATASFIGWKSIVVDTWYGLTDFLFVEPRTTQNTVARTAPILDWKVVLYHGQQEGYLPHRSMDGMIAKKEKNR